MYSQENTIKQQDLVNALVEKGVDGLVVIPTDTSAMDTITEVTQKAGIPLVYINRNPFSIKKIQCLTMFTINDFRYT